MPGRATPIGPFTRVAAAEAIYITPSSAVRRRPGGLCKAQKKAKSARVVKKVKVMSKMTMRARIKNSSLVARTRNLHGPYKNRKNGRAKRKTNRTHPAAAKAGGKRADHSDMPKAR